MVTYILSMMSDFRLVMCYSVVSIMVVFVINFKTKLVVYLYITVCKMGVLYNL
jgi:hypothetical protein